MEAWCCGRTTSERKSLDPKEAVADMASDWTAKIPEMTSIPAEEVIERSRSTSLAGFLTSKRSEWS